MPVARRLLARLLSRVTGIIAACVIVACLIAAAPARAQQPLDAAKVAEALDRDGRFVFERSGVLALRYDFVLEGDSVEAIAFRPVADSIFPGLLLIPGFSRTARDHIPLALRFAREGFACVAITQRGFGRSTGAPDFVGPKTVAALEAGYRRFRLEAYVDSTRMGVFGFSRGAMAASLLAVRLGPQEIQAAIFAAGIYDFKSAHDEIQIPEIRANMETEAGQTEEAVYDRSSLPRMDHLPCPVLIIHGTKDENAPVTQAYALRDRLAALKKEYEFIPLPDRGHDLSPQEIFEPTREFLRRRLHPADSRD